ncbi:hypothetical protein GXP65_01720 [Vibrio campbellii]|uniref:DoxX family protein n=1 Tax=Vibrio sp. LB10LO1 TaxID=2711207 RepID=UPI00138A1D92|nr:hypothetical protein [Vibrio sp. LB10LO1]
MLVSSIIFDGAFFIPAKSAAMFLVGLVEVTGAILMLIGLLSTNNLLSAIGASFIVFTSVGAMFFHFRFDTWKDAIPSIVTLLLSLLVTSPLIEFVALI